MALTQDEIDAIQKDLHKNDGEQPPRGEAPSFLSNGLKAALVAGGLLGAGFLLWRWREGSRADDDAKVLAELEAHAAPPQLAQGGAPVAHCSCGSQPDAFLEALRGQHDDLREQVLRRIRS
jgi:hypothetical protein